MTDCAELKQFETVLILSVKKMVPNELLSVCFNLFISLYSSLVLSARN